MNADGRVMGRLGARELTQLECEQTTGAGAIKTGQCTFDVKTQSLDCDPSNV